MTKTWDASTYDRGHSYVWQKAADLVDLLDPQPNERILDVGCGTGHLTAEIARHSAKVAGMDASPQMIEKAKSTHPHLEFFVGDVTQFTVDQPYDAIFSNATLHWVKRAQDAAHRIADALRQGGRFVAEFGGKGNVQRVSQAMTQALRAAGAPSMEELSPWYFPSIAEYAGVLERAGLETSFARLFDRPTEVEGGIREWVKMFGSTLIENVPPDRLNEFWTTLDQAGQSLQRDGRWYADYRRLRVVATKV